MAVQPRHGWTVRVARLTNSVAPPAALAPRKHSLTNALVFPFSRGLPEMPNTTVLRNSSLLLQMEFGPS